MTKEFIDWFIATFGAEFHISTEQQRQNLPSLNHVFRGAWMAWQALYKEWKGADGEMPKIGQKVILCRNGIVQTDTFTFDSGDAGDYHTAYFWSNDNVDDDVPLLASDRWQPLPEVK
jgi:hypothetical protein